MKRHQGYINLDPSDRGVSVAIGNFDGVHLGHQSVIALAKAAAAELDCPVGVVTFEPHPRSFFAPNAPAFRLMNSEARAHRMEKLGVDHLFEIGFDARTAAMTADHFVAEILVAGLGVRHVVVGADFRYGRARRGDAYLLQALGRGHRFEVTIAPLVGSSTQDYSSTAIRKALAAGDPGEAARILGHWHRIDGTVSRGDQRGRDMGYPTANLNLAGLHLPKFGVYAVLFDVLSGPHAGSYRGVASLGERPTFGAQAPNLETHVFDFADDIYDQEVSVALVEFLRPEEKYDSPEVLIAQMDRDAADARAALDRIGAAP
ncbi:MAG: bifunctional riboflavin kinase/FAD synthetase [Pseudomonadota bacterium]